MSGSKERQFRANKLNASRNSVYPGPWGQLAQNALFALVSLPRLPGEGGWMQTACWELFLDCFEQELSRKMQLGTRVCAEELSNHFLPWMYFQCLGTPFFFPAGMQPSCSRIYLQGEMLQVLPSSSHPLGSGPRLFFQILSKCADEGERFCITSLHQRDTAPCMKRSGLQDLTLGRIWLRQPQSCRLFHNC